MQNGVTSSNVTPEIAFQQNHTAGIVAGVQLVTAFDDLGPQQGAVLTYAPYVGILLSDDPFGF